MSKTKRLFSIINLLTQNPAYSPQELAEKLEVSERSVYRYLSELQAIGFNFRQAENLTNKRVKQLLPPITFTAAELLALAAACQSLFNQKGLPYAELLESAMQKAEGALASLDDKRAYYRMRSHFTYLNNTLRDYSPWKEMIFTINTCIRYNKSVIVKYDSFSSSEISERELDPYDLFFQDGNLYLAAYCHNRKKVRTFRIDRMLKVRPLKRTFEKDPSFNLINYLGSSWRIWRSTEEITIKFIVFPPTSRLFKESFYHESQQIEELSGEKIHCTITTYNTPEVKSWLLSLGKQIKILEPKELVQEIKEELQESLKNLCAHNNSEF